MTPIVNGLETEFSPDVTFVYLNARDGAEGQAAFESLNLPGHPSYVLFSSGRQETYRSFGIVEAAQLRTAIQNTR